MGERQHALYRFYGDGGVLLYVGITHNPGRRWGKHRDDKPWWAEVVGITIEQHPTREAVLEAERAAILAEHPCYNVVHNGRRPPPMETVSAEDMPDCCHDWCVPEHGDWSVYFPHTWVEGVGHYRCRRGHVWTCHWGHRGSGMADLPPVVIELGPGASV